MNHRFNPWSDDISTHKMCAWMKISGEYINIPLEFEEMLDNLARYSRE